MWDFLERHGLCLGTVVLSDEHRITAPGADETEYLLRVAVFDMDHARAPGRIVERGVGIAKADPVADQRGVGMVLPRDRIALEEFEALGVARFLPVVDERDTLRGEQEREGVGQRRSEPLELGSRPGILVMVGGEDHALRAGRPGALILAVET